MLRCTVKVLKFGASWCNVEKVQEGVCVAMRLKYRSISHFSSHFFPSSKSRREMQLACLGLAEWLARSHTTTHIYKGKSSWTCQLMRRQQLGLAMPVPSSTLFDPRHIVSLSASPSSLSACLHTDVRTCQEKTLKHRTVLLHNFPI